MAGALVVSLDFELHWGVRDHTSVDGYRARLLGVRSAIPAMLDLMSRRGVHATWATVGFLLFEGRDDLASALPSPLPSYRTSALSPYGDIDALGDSEQEDPFHFAPTLVRRIAATEGQELATHTFSHFYCAEAGVSREAFEADLRAAVSTARARFGVDIHSIVFPRNQARADYLDILERVGITNFRGCQAGWMHSVAATDEQTLLRRGARLVDTYVDLSGPSRPELCGRLVNLPASAFLRPWSRRLRHLDRIRVHRIREGLRRASREDSVFHLWWHPHNFGVDLEENLRVLSAVLDTYVELKETEGMVSCTMDEAAEWFRSKAS